MMTMNQPGRERPKLILVDIYETLLDMSEVERKVSNIYNNKNGYTIWYNLFMQYCFVDNCIDQFNDFPAIARATMQMTGQILSKSITEGDISQVLDLLKQLPLHPGVLEGLSLLNDEGFIIVALTNSPERTVIERMERTGLISYFKRILSAEHVGKYKPYIDVYNWAIREMQQLAADSLMVSAHGWDIAGVANAGLQTAYLIQSHQILYPLAPQPDYTCHSLSELGRFFNTSGKRSLD